MKSEICKLLGCQTRYDIFQLLVSHNNICICHIESKLGLTQANASKHMKLFRELGVVDYVKSGKNVYYHLNDSFTKEHQLLIDYVMEGEDYETEDCCPC